MIVREIGKAILPSEVLKAGIKKLGLVALEARRCSEGAYHMGLGSAAAATGWNAAIEIKTASVTMPLFYDHAPPLSIGAFCPIGSINSTWVIVCQAKVAEKKKRPRLGP